MTRKTVVYRGVPAWIIVLVMAALIQRHHQLRHRPGNVTVRLRSDSGARWSRGNGVWVDDVFAVRQGIGDRSESYLRVTSVSTRSPEADEGKLLRLEEPVIALVQLADGESIEIAFPRKQQSLLLGPFATDDSVSPEMSNIEQIGVANTEQTVAVAS